MLTLIGRKSSAQVVNTSRRTRTRTRTRTHTWRHSLVHAFHVVGLVALASLGSGVRFVDASAAPFVEFLGQTFYVTRGEMQGSLDVAFDPIEREVLSVALTDPCGDGVQTGFADQGASWDPVDERLWTINQAREVKFWEDGSQTLLFTIPEIFEVPGVGPDTLESVRGLALDMEYVYVVDAGPDFGEIESNAWFKFTRDGVPVSSSKATDFTSQLDAAPDAIVDGICWIPPGSPFGEGLFLVALEHSGIQVIDENGFFVDEIVWQHEDIPLGAVPFAFAGITIDPLTGDLFLVENSESQMYVWVRLPDDEDAPVAYSIGAPQLRIHTETGECARRTFYGTGSTGDIFFSLAYRESDGGFWTSDYNSGRLYILDPRSGLKSDTGISGPVNIWGMAYDSTNDRLFLHASDAQEMHVYEFSSGLFSQLPEQTGVFARDIAYRPMDGFLYSVAGGVPSELVRIDPQTGEATAVGPTADVVGLDYDASSDRILGIIRATAQLVSIDPGTGAWTVEEELGEQAFSWEALGIIPHSPGATSSADEWEDWGEWDDWDDGGGPAGAARLKVTPNPTSGRVQLDCRIGSSSVDEMEIHVIDAQGRRVRTLRPGNGSGSDGMQSVTWDGKDQAGRVVPSGIYYAVTRSAALRRDLGPVSTEGMDAASPTDESRGVAKIVVRR